MTARQDRVSVPSAVGENRRRIQILEAVAATGGGGGIQFNSGTYGADNVGDYTIIEAVGTGITGDFSEASLASATGYSIGVTTEHGMIVTGTTALNQWVLTVEVDQTGAVGADALEVIASASTGSTTGIDVGYGNASAGSAPQRGINVGGGGVTSNQTTAVRASDINSGTGLSVGVDVTARATGGGDSVGVKSRARVSGGGAAYCYQGYDNAGTLIFAVDNSGNVHIPAAAAVINDL